MVGDFVDFGDVDVKSKFSEKYKGNPGQKDRISIIYPKDTATYGAGPFVMRNTHFSDKYFVCKEGICCDKLGPSSQRFVCLIVHYKTDKKGMIIKQDGEKVPFDFKIKPWIFSSKKFTQLKGLHQEWDLKSHDLHVTCGGNEQYQDLELVPCKEALWKVKPDFMEAVYRESEPMRQTLSRELGQDLTIDEIKELLGVGIAQPSEAISNESDLNDILQQV